MFLTRSTIDTAVIDNQIAFINSNIVEQVGTQVAQEFQPRISDRLTVEPGPPVPGAFAEHATPKQRRYVMAKIRRGEWTGRTGALQNAWVISSTFSGNSFTMIAQNNTPYGPFVYGGATLSNVGFGSRGAGRFQQRFHQITGWPLQAQVVNEEYDAMQARFAELYNAAVQDMGQAVASRRGYTRTPPRRR